MLNNTNALAVYKNKPALVTDKDGDKIIIVIHGGEKIKVREKDIEIIHPGPVKNLSEVNDKNLPDGAREAWELLLSEENTVSLKELAELAFGTFEPASAWSAFCLLQDGLYFSGQVNDIAPRPEEMVKAEEAKRDNKNKENEERELFLEALRKRRPVQDKRFVQDVEALAFGKSSKSRTLHDLGIEETPENAHALLLDCGIWTNEINVYPSRFGLSLSPVKNIPNLELPACQTDGSRLDLTRLLSFAIDSPWSNDPDDAISLENIDGRQILYVHVADPAAAIAIDSPADIEARSRGATLYLPEGSFRMIAEEALPVFALGYAAGKAAGTEAQSPALTFKLILNSNGEITETDIFPSFVKVKRLSYQEADELLSDNTNENAEILRGLYDISNRNFDRRCKSGAVNIEMPETRISIDEGQIIIEPIIKHISSAMVRECMLLAGEGAALWAMQRNLPLPYVLQEAGEMPEEIFQGLAGAYQLRRCMLPRSLSVSPGKHQGLGLDSYVQVTSPLRRYTDLFAHIQIRRFLCGEKALSAEEVSQRIFSGEAAASAVVQAERAARNHWIMVFLSDKKDSVWDAITLEKKGNRWVVIIPALALITQVSLRGNVTPNDQIKLVFKSANIPKGEAVFTAV